MNQRAKRLGIVTGFPYYGRYLAQLVNELSNTWELQYLDESYFARIKSMIAMRRADAVISFGGPAPDAAIAEAARRYNVPVLVIWAGTDVIEAGKDPGYLEIIKQEAHTNISDGPWLVDELRELGIDSTYTPVTAIAPPDELAPLPERFRVLTYLPEPRRAFYGEKSVYAIARECPEMQFIVVGKGHANPSAPPNVHFLGHVGDMPNVIDQSTVLLRLPEHDGKSMLVLETLGRGRHVIWTYDFPAVHQVSNMTEAIAQLRSLFDLHARGELDVNRAGFEHARTKFSRPTIAASFERVLDRMVSEHPKATAAKRTVAISGFPLFTAQVARAASWALPDWSPRILRGGSRLARVVAAFQLLRADVWYSIGSPIPDRWLHFVALLARKPRVIHWVGTDVELLKSQPAVRRFSMNGNVTHLAEVDWMIDELAACGLRASLAPLPPQVRAPDVVPPLPERFTLLLYVPRSRGEFYGRREYERLFRHFLGQPIKFIVVGGGSVFVPPGADVEIAGWKTDLSDVYERSSALLRFTRHDGLSLMALEALCYGRHLIWSQDFPFATRVRSYAEIERAVTDLLDAHRRGELTPQMDAARYVRDTYDVARCVQRIAEYWNQPAQSEVRALSPMEANR